MVIVNIGIRKVFTEPPALIQLSGAMTKKQRIELYLDSQKAVLDSKNPYYSTHAGKNPCKHRARDDDLYIVEEGIFGLTDIEKKFMYQLEQLAIEENKELKIYDVKNFWHSILAYFRGVDETPTIISGGKKFTKDIYETEWSSGFENKQKYELTRDTEKLRNGLLFIALGLGFGLLTVLLYPSSTCCLSLIFLAFLITIGCLVIFGDVLDRFFDWAN